MKDLKFVIGKNIHQLRTQKGITQQQLGEQLNYSDKTISKWERGESLPDIIVLKNLADFFQVSLDYLVEEIHGGHQIRQEYMENNNRKNCYIITISSIFMVFLAAVLLYVILTMVIPDTKYPRLCFAYAVPAAVIVWLVFNSIWFNPRKNYIIVSILVWSLLLALYITFFISGYKIWQLLLVGIPAQAIIVIWSKLRGKEPEQGD